MAGFAGIPAVLAAPQYQQHLETATHLVWGTGGSMVPEQEMAAYVARGRASLAAGAV